MSALQNLFANQYGVTIATPSGAPDNSNSGNKPSGEHQLSNAGFEDEPKGMQGLFAQIFAPFNRTTTPGTPKVSDTSGDSLYAAFAKYFRETNLVNMDWERSFGVIRLANYCALYLIQDISGTVYFVDRTHPIQKQPSALQKALSETIVDNMFNGVPTPQSIRMEFVEFCKFNDKVGGNRDFDALANDVVKFLTTDCVITKITY